MSTFPSLPARLESGLIGWLEATRVVLPLKGVEVRFDLHGDLLEVEIDQIYHQNQNRPLDVTYTFPLPDGAAVYRCEMHVNGRVICAKVLPTGEARELAAAMKDRGHRTALVEGIRENLFELGLGNLVPGDTVVIRLAYVQTLDREGPDAASFRVPMTPGIRYIPGEPLLRRNQGTGMSDDTDVVPDASRLNPPRIDTLHPDAAYLSCTGTVDPAGWEVGKMTSPSHPLLVQVDGGMVRVRLASHGEVPDRDLVVRFTPARESAVTQAGWTTVSDRHTYAAVRLVAPPSAAKLADKARDFFFLIDRSGSMEGQKWTACSQAFREFLRSLGPLDRAWVTFFESDFQDLAEKPLPAAAILAEPVIARLEELGTGGGTELFPALLHVLEKLDRHASPERETAVVILTDGQVGDEERIHQLLKPRRGKLRVHTFGIDTAVNDAFLRRLAEDHGGACSLATPGDDIVGMVAGIARRMGAAAVRGLRFEGDWEASGATLPPLWEGDAVTVTARCSGSPRELVLRGETSSGAAVTLMVALSPAASPAPRLLWQRERLRWLEREGRADAAVALACEANLLSMGTAFVAWDESERLAVSGPNIEIYQPSLDPSDWESPCASPWGMPSVAGGLISGLRSAVGSITTHLSSPVKRLYAPPMPPSSVVNDAPAGPMISSAQPADWITQLPALLNLQGAVAVQVTDWLEQWLWMDAGQAADRRAALAQIVTQLTSLPTADRKAVFLSWIATNVEAPVREAIERLV